MERRGVRLHFRSLKSAQADKWSSLPYLAVVAVDHVFAYQAYGFANPNDISTWVFNGGDREDGFASHCRSVRNKYPDDWCIGVFLQSVTAQREYAGHARGFANPNDI